MHSNQDHQVSFAENCLDAAVWTSPDGDVSRDSAIEFPPENSDLAIVRFSIRDQPRSIQKLRRVLEDNHAEVVLAHTQYDYADSTKTALLVSLIFYSPLTFFNVSKTWKAFDLYLRAEAASSYWQDYSLIYAWKDEKLFEDLEGVADLPREEAHLRLHAAITRFVPSWQALLHLCPHVGFERCWEQMLPALREADLRDSPYRLSVCETLRHAPTQELDPVERDLRIKLLESLGDPLKATTAAQIF